MEAEASVVHVVLRLRKRAEETRGFEQGCPHRHERPLRLLVQHGEIEAARLESHHEYKHGEVDKVLMGVVGVAHVVPVVQNQRSRCPLPASHGFCVGGVTKQQAHKTLRPRILCDWDTSGEGLLVALVGEAQHGSTALQAIPDVVAAVFGAQRRQIHRHSLPVTRRDWHIDVMQLALTHDLRLATALARHVFVSLPICYPLISQTHVAPIRFWLCVLRSIAAHRHAPQGVILLERCGGRGRRCWRRGRRRRRRGRGWRQRGRGWRQRD
mmetsp:Transcript_64731/g.141023  ORF Transcript_64731/g.141023 Transcript_64731/m.141023 type:complete len:268 (+) Transcript_64731:1016-1819(+)